MSSEIQHQLNEGMSLTAGYYRNWYGNFSVTDNLVVSPADYGSYCITAPSDMRLPGGGGYQVCGLADVSLAKFGLVDNEVTQSANFGEQRQVNNFFSVSLNTRFASGIRFGGGVDAGRSVTDNCFVVDSPQQLVNCKVVTPFKGQTQIKFNGSYPLPYDFIISGILQNISGPVITAAYAATNAEIAPSLGRSLAACGTRTPCASTATVPLVEPGTQFEDRTTRLDLRVTKMLSVSPRLRLQLNLDLYNALNSSDILSITTTFGPRWRQPTQILDPRIVQFSGQLLF